MGLRRTICGSGNREPFGHLGATVLTVDSNPPQESSPFAIRADRGTRRFSTLCATERTWRAHSDLLKTTPDSGAQREIDTPSETVCVTELPSGYLVANACPALPSPFPLPPFTRLASRRRSYRSSIRARSRPDTRQGFCRGRRTPQRARAATTGASENS